MRPLATLVFPAIVTFSAARAAATTTLTVDLSSTLHPVAHAASGSLYGITEKVPADLATLVLPLHPHVFNNPAADVQQPVGDAIAVAARVAPLGARVSIRLADWFPGWPYRFTNMSDWFDKLGQTVSRKLASNVDAYYGYEIWNEPNGTWTSQMSFDDFWQQTYAELRTLDPGAKIIGPSISYYDASYLQSFLTFAKANDCVPDIVSWHELSGGDLTANFQNYRKLEQQLGLGPLPISINEYSGKNDLTDEGMPGASAPMIAKFERFGVDSACISYWDVAHPGRLGSLLASDTAPNGGFWFYAWYGDMAGNMVSTTPPSPNDPAALDGFANVDAGAGKASVLFGGVNDGTINVVLSGFRAVSLFGSKVHAVVEHTHWVNRTTPVTATDTVSTADVSVSDDELSVAVTGANDTDGYRLTLTPLGGGAGDAPGSGGAAAGGRSATGGAGGVAGVSAGTAGAGDDGGASGRAGIATGGGGVVAGGGVAGANGGDHDGGPTHSGGTSAGSSGVIGAGMSQGGRAGEMPSSAGAAVRTGAGSGGDARAPSSSPATSSGCGCSVERDGTRPWPALAGLVFVLLVRARANTRRARFAPKARAAG